MASLLNIKSIFNLKLIFEFTEEKMKYNLFKYSKIFQSKLSLNIFDYKKAIFTKNIQKITKNNLLDYYDYLKRKYLNKYNLQDIKNYFVEFFCKFLDENKINFELNTSYELIKDILLCDSLKTIQLIINLDDYKSSYKSEIIKDKNKKSFLPLFQTIFDTKRISKISQIIIISKDNNKENISGVDNYLLVDILIRNIYKFKPKIKTNIIDIYKKIYNYIRQLNDYNSENENYEIFKLWELTVPSREYYIGYHDIVRIIKLDIDLNKPFNINHLDFIKSNKIRNYFLKIKYKDLWSFYDDFSNVKKLELSLDYHDEIIDDIENFPKVNSILSRGERGRGWRRGRGGKDLNEIRIEEMTKNFNKNNTRYIEYFNKLYYLYKENNNEKKNLKILYFLEKSEFDDLTIIIDDINGHNPAQFSLNKFGNSITLFVEYYNPKENEFLNELKKYNSVNLYIFSVYNEENKESYNLFKFDEDSKIKYFYLSVYFFQCFIPRYSIEFPINFDIIITLDLYYTLVLNEKTHINFPLTEDNCKYTFRNLKNLKLNFFYDCETCVYNSPKNLIPNLIKNFKYCPVLENLDISYEIFESKLEEIKIILEGIKELKNLKSLYLNDKSKERSIITTDEFYRSYPEYVDFCPFLNDIKIELSEFFKYDLLYEKKINYKINEVVISDYLYIKTLGEKSSYSTYLCKNKKNIKVVIRKFKKSRINNSLDLFENEKYCLQKFKNVPNFINYIEFLNDEHFEFEYIVYEYIENTIQHCKSKILQNKICNFLDNFYKFHARKDTNIILLPIFPTNILIKDNYDIILIGFGYLNLYPSDKEKNGKLNSFYYNMDEYYKENFSLIPLSDEYNEYMNDIKNYYSFNYNWSYGLAKIKFQAIKIKKELKLINQLEIGKIIPTKDCIFTLQNNSIIIYNKKNFKQVADIQFPLKEEEEEEDDEEEEEDENQKKNNLLSFILIEGNILIALNAYNIYMISFDKNKLRITDIIENECLKEKNNIYLIKKEYKKDVNFHELAYIEKLDIIIFTSSNGICIWKLNKKQKKLKFIKFYEKSNFYSFFKINSNDIQLIAIGNEKLIFYSIDDKSNLKANFDYIHNIKNWSLYKLKLFKQYEKYCYILIFNVIMIIKINYTQKKIDCLFRCCLGRDIVKNIFPIGNGLLFSSDGSCFKYLTKINDDFEIIDKRIYLEDGEIFDIIKDTNSLFIISKYKILEINNA